MRHYTPEYRTVSAVLRQAWTADPTTRCWLCGRGAIDGDPWQADHVRPGETNSPLRPAHGTCNARRGDNDPPNATM